MIGLSNSERHAARLRIVEEHFENEHDLQGIMRTFGATARYDDEPWGLHYDGHGEVRKFYGEFLAALPELSIDVKSRHVSDTAVILEVIIRGRHAGPWRGLPATESQVELPLCAIFTFDMTALRARRFTMTARNRGRIGARSH